MRQGDIVIADELDVLRNANVPAAKHLINRDCNHIIAGNNAVHIRKLF